jgi:cell division initiation protein
VAPLRLTARDLKEQQFPRRLRGYDPEDVHRFLAAAAEDLGAIEAERDQLKRRVADLEEELGELRDKERSLVDAMLLASEAGEVAQRRADTLLAEAEARRQELIRDAEMRCRELLAEATTRRHELALEVEGLVSRRSYLLSRLRSLVDEQRAILKAHEDRTERDAPAAARLIPMPSPKTGTAAGDDS